MYMTRKQMGSLSTRSECLFGLADSRDLLATLGSFAIAPLWALRRNGLSLTYEEEHAYLAVWRHIG
jgi:hypothetical protein